MKIKIPNTMAAPKINDRQRALILNEIYMHKFRGKDLPDRRKKVFGNVFRMHAQFELEEFFEEREVESFPEAVECLDGIVNTVVDFFNSDLFEKERVRMYAEESANIEMEKKVKAAIGYLIRRLAAYECLFTAYRFSSQSQGHIPGHNIDCIAKEKDKYGNTRHEKSY